MSRYYPKGTPKSSVHLVVLHTSIVLFAECTSEGPPNVCTTDNYVRPPPEDQCLAFIF
jgi:hypothetical protein